jgi:hypothetical protein
VASSLVPDLIAYQGPGTSYVGATVAPLQNADLINTGTSDAGPIDVFSVFDALTLTSGRPGYIQDHLSRANVAFDLAANQGPSEFAARTSGQQLMPAGSMPAGGGGMMVLDITAAHDAVLSDWSLSPGISRKPAAVLRSVFRGFGTPVGVVPRPIASRRASNVLAVDMLFGDTKAAKSLLDDVGSLHLAKKYKA